MKDNFLNIDDFGEINFSMDVGVKEITPTLENLKVTPTKEQQVFTHENSYGYDNVTVNPIPEEYIIPEGTLPITENTTYDVTTYARVTASVRPALTLQDKEITPNKQTQTITSDNGYDGLNQVTVNPIPDEYVVPSGTLEITENGIYDVKGYTETNVNVGGGEAEGITSLKNLESKFVECVQQFDNMVDTYHTYTTEPVTLYTPETGFNYYILRKRIGSEEYQIMWFDRPYYIHNLDTGTIDIATLSFSSTSYRKPFEITNATNITIVATTPRPFYQTDYFSSFEGCVNAIQDATTQYNKTTPASYRWGNDRVYSEDGKYTYSVAGTNLPCLISLEQNGFSRRVSSDETIIVK